MKIDEFLYIIDYKAYKNWLVLLLSNFVKNEHGKYKVLVRIFTIKCGVRYSDSGVLAYDLRTKNAVVFLTTAFFANFFQKLGSGQKWTCPTLVASNWRLVTGNWLTARASMIMAFQNISIYFYDIFMELEFSYLSPLKIK